MNRLSEPTLKILIGAMLLVTACNLATTVPTPDPTPTIVPSATPSPTFTPEPTATPQPTATSTPTDAPTLAPTNTPRATPIPTESAQAHFDNAMADIRQGDYADAIGELNQAIALRGDDAVAFYERGIAYASQGDEDHALADYTKAIQLQGDYLNAYCGRAEAYAWSANYRRAIADADTAIQMEPDAVCGYFFRALAYRLMRDYDRAISDYDKVIQLQPDYAGAYLQRGRCYWYKKDEVRGLADVNRAIELAPDFAEAYYWRGVHYFQQGDYDGALADFDLAIRYDPTDEYAYLYRGDCHRFRHENTLARADYQKVLELSKDQQARQQAQDGLDALPAVDTGVSSTLKIALLLPLSGASPSFGTSARDGALFAIDEWNATGGVLGKKIEAVIEDSQCLANPARNAANKVIDQDGVHYIVGEVCSSASISISEVAEAKHVVQISPTSTDPKVTLNADGSTKQYAFRACFIDPFQGKVMAKFAWAKGYRTAFVMYDPGNDYVRGLAESFIVAFQSSGGNVMGKETYAGTATDFSAILAKVADAKPDVLYLPDYYNVVNLIGKQAKAKGITAVMMGGDGWDSSHLNLQAADGGFYSNHYDTGDTRAVMTTWIAAYGKKYQAAVPDAIAALSYDATNLMLTAIQKAGADDPAKVKDVLAGIKFNGVTGPLYFDAQHNPIKSAVVMQIRNDEKVYAGTVVP